MSLECMLTLSLACVKSLACVTAFLMDEALQSIRPSVYGHLVKTLITLEPHGIFGSIFIFIHFNIVQPLVCKMGTRLCRPTGRGRLVKTLITLEPHGIF